MIFIIRILICFILSILVGFERQLRHKNVGLRTNVLVCLGSFLFVYLSFGVAKGDPTRIAAQVVSGIGFLGTGVILRDGDKIKGLNTAATLWCNAAIGALCAAGLLTEAAIGTLFVLFSNVILRVFSLFVMNKVKIKSTKKYTVNIKCKKSNEEKVRTGFMNYIEKKYLIVNGFDMVEEDNLCNLKIVLLTSTFSKIDDIVTKMMIFPGVISINYKQDNLIQMDNQDDLEDE